MAVKKLDKNILIYKPPRELIKRIEFIAETKGVSRNELIIDALEKIFPEGQDYEDQRRISEKIDDTHTLIYALEKETRKTNEIYQEMFRTLLGQ